MRFLPLNILLGKLGDEMCTVTWKHLHLTRSDVTSSIGTKRASLKANPNQYLQHFGLNVHLNDDKGRQAEQHLVKVLDPIYNCISFNELQFEWYVDRKVSLIDLPPTSGSLSGHTMWCHLIAYQLIHLLTGTDEIDVLTTARAKQLTVALYQRECCCQLNWISHLNWNILIIRLVSFCKLCSPQCFVTNYT